MWGPFRHKKESCDCNGENSDSINTVIQERGRIIDNQVDTLQNQRLVASNIFRASILIFSVIISAVGYVGFNPNLTVDIPNTTADASGFWLFDLIVEILPVDIALAAIVFLLYLAFYLLYFLYISITNSLGILYNEYILSEKYVPANEKRDSKRGKFDTVGSEAEIDKVELVRNQKELIDSLSENIKDNENYLRRISTSGRAFVFSITTPMAVFVLISILYRYGLFDGYEYWYGILIVLVTLLGPFLAFTYYYIKD